MKTYTMTLKFQFFLAFFLLTSVILRAQIAPAIDLEEIASGFDKVVDIVNAGDDRLFLVEQDGYVQLIDTAGNSFPAPFMDIDLLVNSTGNEQGLLGLTFHPDYATNGFFYVNYTNPSNNTVISRWSVSSSNPDQFDPASEMVLMTITQPYWNHNAGDLEFGPDGYLYIPLGDGGSAGDPGNRAQNPLERLGKILRIDVDGGTPYAIPPDNPFVGTTDTLDEIWSLGWRNPWRLAFDTEGNMWVGDVGQDAFEEIDFEAGGSSGGGNYGWKCYEADAPYSPGGCAAASSYINPAFGYSHAEGQSVTGGFVYEGAAYPGLQGWYIFVDFVSGQHWGTKADVCSGELLTEKIGLVEEGVGTFGLDSYNELYLASLYTGKVFRIIDSCAQYPIPELTLVDEGLVVSNAANGSIQWYENCVPVSGATDTLFSSPNFDTLYYALITYADGCTRVSPSDAIVHPTGLDANLSELNLVVKPNPANQQVTIAFSSSLPLEKPLVSVYDITGRVVLTEELLAGLPASFKHEFHFNTSSLPDGWYQVVISSGAYHLSGKLMIQH